MSGGKVHSVVLKWGYKRPFRRSQLQHHPTLLDATCWPHLKTILDDVLMLNDVGIMLEYVALGTCLKFSSEIVQH